MPTLREAAQQEPVAWEWRWFDTSPYTVTSGQWSEWKRVEPRNPLCTLEDALNEFRAYIAKGQRYELRALYTTPQPVKLAERKPLTDEEIDALELPPSGTATVRDLVRLIERAHGITGEIERQHFVKQPAKREPI